MAEQHLTPLGPEVQASWEGLRQQVDPASPPIIREEYVSRFIMGDLTAADMLGLNRNELYLIARRGYELLEQGKLDQAQLVFDGLARLDPYDPYFYSVLGSIRQQKDDLAGALACYDQTLQLQPWNVTALANRGEIRFRQGLLTEAVQDFQRVIELDPNNTHRSTLRAKTIVIALREALNQPTGTA